MRFTRSRPERRRWAGVIGVCGALGAAIANCGGDDERTGFTGSDAGVDAVLPSADAAVPLFDASVDAPPFDASAPEIVCAGGPCATSLTSTWVMFADDSQSVCVLLKDKTVACWGANGLGQLGRGEEAGTSDSATAARVAGLSNIVSLDRTCAIDGDGATFCWGSGPIANGDGTGVTTERAPVKMAISRAKKVSVTRQVGCAIVDDGSVTCWGSNTSGQVARFDGTNQYRTLPPTPVPLPPNRRALDISVGDATFVVLDDGTTWSWGATPPLGRPTSLFPDDVPQPLSLAGVAAIDAEGVNACASVAGTAHCWGGGPPNSRFVDLSRALPIPVVTAEPIRQISATAQRTVRDPASNELVALPDRWCAVGTSGAVYCWGANGSGQAGDGSRDHAYVPVKVRDLPEPAVHVEAMFDATCALLVSGKVYCWGSDFYGQLGNGMLKVSSLSPREVVLP